MNGTGYSYTPAPWGADLNGRPVTSQQQFNAAVTMLSTPSGHNPAATGWANPPRWAAHASMMNTPVYTSSTGGAIFDMVQDLQARRERLFSTRCRTDALSLGL